MRPAGAAMFGMPRSQRPLEDGPRIPGKCLGNMMVRSDGGGRQGRRHVVGAGDAVSNTHFEYLLWVTISTPFSVMMFVGWTDTRPPPRAVSVLASPRRRIFIRHGALERSFPIPNLCDDRGGYFNKFEHVLLLGTTAPSRLGKAPPGAAQTTSCPTQILNASKSAASRSTSHGGLAPAIVER